MAAVSHRPPTYRGDTCGPDPTLRTIHLQRIVDPTPPRHARPLQSNTAPPPEGPSLYWKPASYQLASLLLQSSVAGSPYSYEVVGSVILVEDLLPEPRLSDEPQREASRGLPTDHTECTSSYERSDYRRCSRRYSKKLQRCAGMMRTYSPILSPPSYDSLRAPQPYVQSYILTTYYLPPPPHVR